MSRNAGRGGLPFGREGYPQVHVRTELASSSPSQIYPVLIYQLASSQRLLVPCFRRPCMTQDIHWKSEGWPGAGSQKYWAPRCSEVFPPGGQTGFQGRYSRPTMSLRHSAREETMAREQRESKGLEPRKDLNPNVHPVVDRTRSRRQSGDEAGLSWRSAPGLLLIGHVEKLRMTLRVG